MNRSVHTFPVTIAALVLVAACGGDDDAEADADPPAAETTAAPTTTEASTTTAAPTTTEAPATSPPTTEDVGPRPVYTGVLELGTYRNKKFGAPLTFTTASEWEALESAKSLVLFRDPDDGVAAGELALIRDPERSVDEVVQALRATEGVEFSEPEPVTIAGVDGVVVTTEPLAADIDFTWMTDPDFGYWFAAAGVRNEVYVVDAGGTTMIVWIDAEPDAWDAFRAEAQALLDTITWAE